MSEPIYDVRIDGDIPPFEELVFSRELSDPGSATMRIDPTHPWWREHADLLDSEIPVEVREAGEWRWSGVLDEEDSTSEDTDTTTLVGRGDAAQLERATVLPAGYPNHDERSREWTDAHPMDVLAELFTEAKGRGALPGLEAGFTTGEDSDGQPWQESVDVELDPGGDLLERLREFADLEAAEWAVIDGTLEARHDWGTDRSDQVIFFVARDQQRRQVRRSARDVRNRAYVEGPTGITEEADDASESAWGRREVWVQTGDAADPATRQRYASTLLRQQASAAVERTVAVTVGEYRPFVDYDVGDWVGLDTGSGIAAVRVLAITVTIGDHVSVELTLETIHEVRDRRLDRALERMSDVSMAASSSVQRRHGLIKANRIVSGEIQVDEEISSTGFEAGEQGWQITGDGDAEFNDVTVRGHIEADSGEIGGYTIEGDRLSGDGRITGGTVEAARFENDGVRITETTVGFGDWQNDDQADIVVLFDSLQIQAPEQGTGDLILDASDTFVTGNFDVSGSKDFRIPHPTKRGRDLRHGSYEGPVPGGLVYRLTATVDEQLTATVNLPAYVPHIARDAQVWTQPDGHLGRAHAHVDDRAVHVTADQPGRYQLLVLATRADPNVDGWDPEPPADPARDAKRWRGQRRPGPPSDSEAIEHAEQRRTS